MKNLLLSLFAFCTLIANSQSYKFSQSSAAYTNLVGSTSVLNSAWVDFEEAIKCLLPLNIGEHL